MCSSGSAGVRCAAFVCMRTLAEAIVVADSTSKEEALDVEKDAVEK